MNKPRNKSAAVVYSYYHYVGTEERILNPNCPCMILLDALRRRTHSTNDGNPICITERFRAISMT